MKKLVLYCSALVLILTSLLGCSSKSVELNISAAASLQDAAKELQNLYNQEHPDVKILYNFGASGTLQHQIEEGAPTDLFISAGKKQMDALEEQNMLLENSRVNLLTNELVLITGKDSQLTGFEGLTEDTIQKISIGVPETVPAGNYAKEALTNLGLWDTLQPKLVLAKDVRQVLTYVETGNVEAGLVYRSDAATSKAVKIVTTAPEDSHAPIVYPMAVIKQSAHSQEAQEFAAFLQSDKAAEIFEKYGFTAVKQP